MDLQKAVLDYDAERELNNKVVQSPYAQDLDSERYGVLIRDWKADIELFREENVPLQTEDIKLGQE